MTDSTNLGFGDRICDTPGRCSVAGICVALVLTLLSLAGIWAIIFLGTSPSQIPPRPYRWVAELFFLWCLPFFLAIWKLTAATLEEKFGRENGIRNTQEPSLHSPQADNGARESEYGDTG